MFFRSLRDQKCFCKPTFIQNLSIIDAFISENNATASSSNIICSVTELCVDALPVLSSSQQKNIFKVRFYLLAGINLLIKNMCIIGLVNSLRSDIFLSVGELHNYGMYI